IRLSAASPTSTISAYLPQPSAKVTPITFRVLANLSTGSTGLPIAPSPTVRVTARRRQPNQCRSGDIQVAMALGSGAQARCGRAALAVATGRSTQPFGTRAAPVLRGHARRDQSHVPSEATK